VVGLRLKLFDSTLTRCSSAWACWKKAKSYTPISSRTISLYVLCSRSLCSLANPCRSMRPRKFSKFAILVPLPMLLKTTRSLLILWVDFTELRKLVSHIEDLFYYNTNLWFSTGHAFRISCWYVVRGLHTFWAVDRQNSLHWAFEQPNASLNNGVPRKVQPQNVEERPMRCWPFQRQTGLSQRRERQIWKGEILGLLFSFLLFSPSFLQHTYISCIHLRHRNLLPFLKRYISSLWLFMGLHRLTYFGHNRMW